MHGHRLDAEFAAGALDAQRNFAPIAIRIFSNTG